MSVMTAEATQVLTKSQVNQVVRFAASEAAEHTDETDHWRRWLSLAVEHDVSAVAFYDVMHQFENYAYVETCDLKLAFEEPSNDPYYRVYYLEHADDMLNAEVNSLVNVIAGVR